MPLGYLSHAHPAVWYGATSMGMDAERGELPPTYLTFAEHHAMSVDERHEYNSTTGDPETDFAKLSLHGQIVGRVPDAATWRAAIRRQARAAGLKIRTAAEEDVVLAYTLAYVNEFDHGSLAGTDFIDDVLNGRE